MTTISPAFAFPAFAPQRRAVNGLALLSLTVGILQYLVFFVPTSLITIPLALNALQRCEPANREGRAMAIAGLALSVTQLLGYVALFVWLLA
ncbi:DUF4190 domain-containing protein [Mycobacterium asiaticum]|uniref:DUF4190 domain-containing protein n=1 Tax=Mycobacterium asiaticum TaxID=1790 RepID=A0A1A3NUE8_MYCAS|nr:DUF4190 domain-containing protein [Mycobacterium asiaticum]OBK23947.1 hypothetical protein A5635_18505 [Mycobacterium asiaticum]